MVINQLAATGPVSMSKSRSALAPAVAQRTQGVLARLGKSKSHTSPGIATAFAMMVAAKNLPTSHYVDYEVVFN